MLPLPPDVEPVSLGEGGTPLLRARKFADDVDLWIKDESLNPTQSFKARGMSVAVSKISSRVPKPPGKMTSDFDLLQQLEPTGGVLFYNRL